MAAKTATKKTAAAKKPAAKKAAASPKAKSATSTGRSNQRHLAEGLVEQFELTKKDANAAVAHVFDEITRRMKKGEVVAISGFGRFVVRDRPARLGRNPATGETVKIPAKKAAKFTPAKALKEACGVKPRAAKK